VEGEAMEKLDRPLDRFVLGVIAAGVVAPQGFEVSVEEVLVLLQSMLEPCVLYDGVMAGDVMPLRVAPMIGLCCGCAREGLPMPGFEGAMAGKAELSELNVLSGVIALPDALGAERLVCGGGDTGGLDHEKAAAGDAFLIDPVLAAGRDGRIVEEDADVGAVAHGSALPPSMSEPVFVL
jgi:hypothetical protein